MCKNCRWCFHYNKKEDHECSKHKGPTGNCDSCTDWFPNEEITNMYEIPDLEDGYVMYDRTELWKRYHANEEEEKVQTL